MILNPTALDTIAEFGTQEDEVLDYLTYNIQVFTDTETKILSKTLEQWCNSTNYTNVQTNIQKHN